MPSRKKTLTVDIRLPKEHADWLASVVMVSGLSQNTVLTVILAMAIHQEMSSSIGKWPLSGKRS